MAEISQSVNIEMLEKLPDGTYKRKYPKTRSDTGVTFDEHLAEYVSHSGYGSASGTNAKTITLNPAPVEYVEGMTIAFKNVTQNSGVVTINVNGLGAKSILKSNGSALASGNLKANSIYTVRYNGSNFILQGEGGEYGTATPSDVLQGKTIGTDDGLVSGTIPSKSAQTYTPRTYNQTIASGRYLTGTQTILGSTNLKSENIKRGVSIFGVSGSVVTPGIDWVVETPPIASDVIAVFIQNGIQFVVMYEDTVNYKPALYTRPNVSSSWVKCTIPFTQYEISGISYGLGLYVMTGNQPYKCVATSPDGINWTLRSISFYYPNESSKTLYYADGLFIVGGNTTGGQYATSTNGTSWTVRTLSTGTVHGLVKGNNLWVLGHNENIFTSTNGTSWTNRGKPFSGTASALALGYGKGLFIAGGNSGVISTSPDGITWTQRTSLGGNIWSVRYANGLYVVGAGNGIYTSTDGITWVLRLSGSYRFVDCGDGFIAGGYGGKLANSSW